ncbi:hypothetical protein LO771_17580 [Streptacidiphilus sp. ASG 303]|uniref:hypothetical protein n=1 Tax=Streptacidiphilus sp. ASG 303 TaxID=2896847 RepID=UPI001E3C7837|nr:hypothetical protein [Streptacidiphilus sp. ASG 303]MCD0484154.1 hypothetical protein [Streptacidiphilus sp. ASG 303]
MHPAFHAGCCGADQARAGAPAWPRPEDFLADFAGRTYRSSPLTVHMAHADAAALARDHVRVEALARNVVRLA